MLSDPSTAYICTSPAARRVGLLCGGDASPSKSKQAALDRPSRRLRLKRMPREPKNSKKRASFACTRCHGSKVKCDIMQKGFPCSSCTAKGLANCELFQSKRRNGRNYGLSIPGYNQNAVARENTQISTVVEETQVSLDTLKENDNDNSNHSGSHKNGSQKSALERTAVTDVESEDVVEEVGRGGTTINNQQYGSNQTRDADQLYSPLQMLSPGLSLSLVTPPSRPSSARIPTMDISLFSGGQTLETLEFFIDGAVPPTRNMHASSGCAIDTNAITFVGMSSSLSVLLRRLRDSGHVPMSKLARSEHRVSSQTNTETPPGSESSSSMSGGQGDLLAPEKTTLGQLPAGALEDLLTCYFTKIHPFYPIINRTWFAEKYKYSFVPPLLLNAMCFVACYHCEPCTIHRAGFSSSLQAKEAFYKDAKKLFYEEQEGDLLVTLQSCILLSFYGGQPRSALNCRTWLAMAATIAEELGIHSSTNKTKMNEADKSLLKIIWWTLVTRDAMTTAFFGRPQKICDQRCDVDMLNFEDFLIVDEDPEGLMFGRRDLTNYHFLIELAKAMEILMKIFSTRYYPRSDPRPCMEEYKLLTEWKSDLPQCVDWDATPQTTTARYLAMTYHLLLIFIFRPRMEDSEQLESSSMETAIRSATEVAKLLAKVGRKNTLAIPQDMYVVLVTAMVILLTDFRQRKLEISKLHLQMCLMILTQAKGCWDHAWWLIDMFEQMLEDDDPEPTARATATGDDNFGFVSQIW